MPMSPLDLSLEEVCERALRLPCAPTLLPRLLGVLGRAESSIEDMEEVIRLDPALGGAVLRLANSAHFADAGAGVDSLHEAVLRLGQKEIYRLAALSIASRWAAYEDFGYEWNPGDFCRVSLVTAVAAEVLAERSRRVSPEVAYTAGLVQGLGKLALAYSCSRAFPAIRRRQRALGCTWLEAEADVLGFSHAMVSAGLLRRWRFPEAFAVVAAHNPPTKAIPAEHLPLAVHVHAANYLAASFGVGQGEEGLLMGLNPELLLEWSFTPEFLEAALPEVFSRATRLMRDRLHEKRALDAGW